MAVRELLKGSLDLMLLTLLADEPTYGYHLAKLLHQRSGGEFALKEGSLYPALHRLEHAGLIQGYWQDRADGARRRYYRLTALGHSVLPERRAEWQRFVTAVGGVLNG